ncbi:MAG: hypothetical protein ACI4L9_04950 [Candidatus Coproplasma sp.]
MDVALKAQQAGGKNSPAVKVVVATLGNDTGIFGAAAFAEIKVKRSN